MTARPALISVMFGTSLLPDWEPAAGLGPPSPTDGRPSACGRGGEGGAGRSRGRTLSADRDRVDVPDAVRQAGLVPAVAVVQGPEDLAPASGAEDLSRRL